MQATLAEELAVAKDSLDPPASVSQTLGFQACVSIPSKAFCSVTNMVANLGVGATHWNCSGTGFLLPTGLSLGRQGTLVGDIV